MCFTKLLFRIPSLNDGQSILDFTKQCDFFFRITLFISRVKLPYFNLLKCITFLLKIWCFVLLKKLIMVQCNRTLCGFRHPDRMAPDQSGEGNILSLAHAGILHSSMLKGISGIFRRFPLWKKERVWAGREYWSGPIPLDLGYFAWEHKNITY